MGKNGSFGLDFERTYTVLEPFKCIGYVMSDGGPVSIPSSGKNDVIEMTIIFDPEQENLVEIQREGWQSILHNFKKYVEQVYADNHKRRSIFSEKRKGRIVTSGPTSTYEKHALWEG